MPVPPTSGPAVSEFNIADEFGTAKRNLPPARIVLIGIAVIFVVIGIIAFKERPKPQGGGSISFVAAAEVPEQHMVLAAITFALHNTAKGTLWVHTLRAQLTTADGHTYEDDAASAVDLDRYYQLFPALKEGTEQALSPETKISAETEKRGTIVVSFPVTKDAFDHRKSLTVTIQPYDQPKPVILN